ncbi:hypothetical protein NGTWS0302_16660 [Mycolicibacterium cyprinidarum]|uniref:Uncharacterized protein n=1 Tax=Mycolicibacterium cyprinidarum TaxID=2860311 RepID=A0ABQ4V4G2_9MYCO|nr:hypothetical protein NGTWS1702_34300 [Mycolicibacterium sp. NGTWSNA01]GJF18457.1 hypothetical protein NGTWS0302_16660 [Mycolicibacterium sp. NGTWS0302]
MPGMEGAGPVTDGTVVHDHVDLESEWWRSPAVLGAQLSDLVAGLDSVSSLPIPYARLPRRLGLYAEEFPRWADVADQTPKHCWSDPSWTRLP